jgi:hypothetical protein
VTDATLSKEKVFKRIDPLSCGDVFCQNNDEDSKFIDVTITHENLSISEATALRDWLNEALS